MRATTAWIAACSLLVLATQSGCLEIEGQRISIRHDAANDRLLLLIHYDGVHDSGNDNDGNAQKQLREAVAEGDVLVHDWPWHFSMEYLRWVADEGRELKEQQRPPSAAEVRFARAWVEHVQPRPLGAYRTVDGHAGALQGLAIDRVSSFLREVDAAIGDWLTHSPPDDPEWSRTVARCRTAAKAGHAWISLEGNAVVVRVPVDRREWVRGKAEAIWEGMQDFLPDSDEEDDEDDDEQGASTSDAAPARLIAALASTPFSLIDDGDQVALRIGLPDTPTTIRWRTGSGYRENLGELLFELVPDDLEDRFAKLLLSEQSGPVVREQHWLEALRDWGPPEVQARSVLQRARDAESPQRERAEAWLDRFGARWNEEQGLPRAPVRGDAEPLDVAAWEKWVRDVILFPLEWHEPEPERVPK